MPEPLPALLRRLLTEDSRPLTQIAAACGLTQPTLTEFLRGRAGGPPRSISIDSAQKLIDLYQVKITAPKRIPRKCAH